MSIHLSPAARHLIDAPNPCALTTFRADGYPVTTIVWCTRSGDDIVLNSPPRRKWLARLRRDPRVSLAIIDMTNMMHYVSIGADVLAIELDDDLALIDELSLVYYGIPWPREMYGEEPGFKITLRPHRVQVEDRPLPPSVPRARD